MKNLATALVKAQDQLHNLSKNAEGYGYKYLTLDKLIDETRMALAECGLVVLQPMESIDGAPAVKTVLMHESGESIEGVYPISPVTMKKCNNAQELGAAVTYARRYGLAAMLNIAQTDDDAASIGKAKQTSEEFLTKMYDEAWDLFNELKNDMNADQRNWAGDELNKKHYKDVVKYLNQFRGLFAAGRTPGSPEID